MSQNVGVKGYKKEKKYDFVTLAEVSDCRDCVGDFGSFNANDVFYYFSTGMFCNGSRLSFDAEYEYFGAGLRLFSKKKEKVNAGTGMDRYVGQRATVLEEVYDDRGVVTIFDERWNARSADKKVYAVGEKVIIQKEENLVLYVGKEK